MEGLIVFIGGGLGALVRYLLSVIIPAKYYLPYHTLFANFLGCFIAATIFTYFILKSDATSIYKMLLITGFCGGLTTLSTLSLEILNYVQNGTYFKAAIYISLTFFICMISVILGVIVAKKFI